MSATFALVHGAWGHGGSWAAVGAELEARGHRAVAPDLPCADVEAGLEEYAAAVREALGGADDAVVVGHSLGGLTVPLVPARKLVFVAAYVPQPGRSLRDRGEQAFGPGFAASVVQDEQRRSFWPDLEAAVHDLQYELTHEEALAAAGRLRRQARRPVNQAWPGDALPNVERAYVVCTRDAVVPPDFQRRLAAELGVEPIELDSGHSPQLVMPRELAGLLDALA